MSDFDSPWKEALDFFLSAFLQFFFPDVHAGIDWSKGYEILDKELEQIAREGDTGERRPDKLFKVWLTDGNVTWILIHVEIQSQQQAEFPTRMYFYNYRIFDRYFRPVLSLAVLGDESLKWRPQKFEYTIFGCRVLLEFPIAKLLDYRDNLASLETSAGEGIARPRTKCRRGTAATQIP